MVVDAQAMLDMEELVPVDYLLPYGLMPTVVPEFKGITVGRYVECMVTIRGQMVVIIHCNAKLQCCQ